MHQRISSYLAPQLEARRISQTQYGVFALQPIPKGSLILLWGGDVMHADQLHLLPPELIPLGIQVDEELYLIAMDVGPADRMNHSCNPNAGIEGQIKVVAMRDIEAGEQVCFDYAMSDGSPYDEFECFCGSHNCRGKITGNDWQLPELQARYQGYFMPYLQRRIDALVNDPS